MNRQNIYICAYPKSGVTWLARLLGDCLNSPVMGATDELTPHTIATEGEHRPGLYAIRPGHQKPVPGIKPEPFYKDDAIKQIYIENLKGNDRVIVLVRDPRAIINSCLYYWGLDNIDTAIKIHMIPLYNFIFSWVSSDFSFLLVKYEDILSDTKTAVKTMLTKLSIPYNDTVVKWAVLRQSFAVKRKAIMRGEFVNHNTDFHLNHMRSGTADSWKNLLTQEQSSQIMDRFSSLSGVLGYYQETK